MLEILRGAEQELAEALEELRELARGIHPAILTDRGLVPALDMLAKRSSLPVDLHASLSDRLPPPVEAAAYYIVAEALTNASKHAAPSASASTCGGSTARRSSRSPTTASAAPSRAAARACAASATGSTRSAAGSSSRARAGHRRARLRARFPRYVPRKTALRRLARTQGGCIRALAPTEDVAGGDAAADFEVHRL